MLLVLVPWTYSDHVGCTSASWYDRVARFRMVGCLSRCCMENIRVSVSQGHFCLGLDMACPTALGLASLLALQSVRGAN